MAIAVPQPRVVTPSSTAGAVGALITAVAALASGFLALFGHEVWTVVSTQPFDYAVYLAVALALQVVSIQVYGRGAVSFAGVGLLAIAFSFGIGPAMAAGAIAGIVNLIRRRGRLDRGLFDASTLALAAGAGAAVFHALGATGLSLESQLGPALLAAVAFLLVNVGLLTTAMGVSEGVSPLAVWQERLRWFTPYYLASGPLALACVTADAAAGLPGLAAFVLPPAFMMVSVRQYLSRTDDAVERLRRANEELVARNEQIRQTNRRTIVALSRSIEAKDNYTGGHTERVSDIAIALGRRLGFREDELEAIEIGALLHDIGKIGVPEHILHKNGPLDEEEWDAMRKHPVISDFILSEVDLHPIVRQIARWSHERLDGQGYPDGIAGDDIPLAARITLVADAFDALTSDRPYRSRRSLAAALEEIHRCTGTQFCPLVVSALEELAEEEPDTLGVLTLRPLAHSA